MAKPSQKPEWASGAATITEPPSTGGANGSKDVGYVANNVPLAGHLNWLFNRIYQWVNYLDTFTAENLTWTGTNDFQEGIEVSGATTTYGVYAEDMGVSSVDQPYLVFGDNSGHIRLQNAANTQSTELQNGRVVVVGGSHGNTDAVTISSATTGTGNALEVSSSSATADAVKIAITGAGSNVGLNIASLKAAAYIASSSTTTYDTVAITSAGQGRTLYLQGAQTSAGTESVLKLNNTSSGKAIEITGNTGNELLVISHNGSDTTKAAITVNGTSTGMQLKLTNSAGTTQNVAQVDGYVVLGDTSTPTQPLANQLCAASISKAWGSFSVAAGTGVQSTLDAHNVASIVASTPSGTTQMAVTFASPMDSANYAVSMAPFTSSGVLRFPHVASKTTNGFVVYFRILAGTDLTSTTDLQGSIIDFSVHARQ